MGDFKNLLNQEASEKNKELTEEINICMFCTYVNGRIKARPMGTLQVDDNYDLWFMTDEDSEKIVEIGINSEIELLYGHGYEKFLSLHGNATVYNDRAKIKELWNPSLKVWFKKGSEDPRIRIIKVDVLDGYYWDVKHNRLVALAKMATSLVTGSRSDDGIEGNLSL